MTDVLPDAGTAFGKRVRARLRDEWVVWFTTVGADGTPQPNPVWFLWDGEGVVIYNLSTARRLTHLCKQPQVSLHFDSDGQGGDIVVLRGCARPLPDHPLPHELPTYLEKYREGMTQVSGSPEAFSEQYPAAVRVEITGVRGY